MVTCGLHLLALNICLSLEFTACQKLDLHVQERREIEAALHDGDLWAVAATNALELGVDVGSLDVTLHLGFPGMLLAFPSHCPVAFPACCLSAFLPTALLPFLPAASLPFLPTVLPPFLP